MKDLYHGTIYDIMEIDITRGKGYKDFGKGFYADKEWVRFVLKNRESDKREHEYDIVIGPTADENTVTVINSYREELIASDYADEVLEQLISDLEPENLPKQYFFGTSAAIQTLRFKKVRREIVG